MEKKVSYPVHRVNPVKNLFIMRQDSRIYKIKFPKGYISGL